MWTICRLKSNHQWDRRLFRFTVFASFWGVESKGSDNMVHLSSLRFLPLAV